MNIILFGAPGSGKGTQAKLIGEKLGFQHISTGDLVRAEIASGSPTGLMIKTIVDGGSFPSDEVIIGLLESVFDRRDERSSGFIFDGFPRTENQAVVLERILAQKNQKIDLIVFLDVSDDVVTKRILGRYSCVSCGAIYNTHYHPTAAEGVCDTCGGTEFDVRTDDTAEAILTRLETYRSMTKPILSYLETKVQVVHVSGDRPVDDIFADIEKHIKEQAARFPACKIAGTA